MKHDLDYMIAVMQAAKEGKEIEAKYLRGCNSNCEWGYSSHQLWDWDHYDYRIKTEEPKPEYVPYESAEEFLQAQRVHGKCVNDSYVAGLGVCVPYINTDNDIILEKGHRKQEYYCIDLVKLLELFKWQDGTSCGKLKE